MSNVVEPATNAEVVAKQLTDVVSHIMKRSSPPMMGLVEEFDLTFAQLKMMFVLAAADGPLPIGRIAELTGQSLPSAGRAVDSLVRSGLATRTEDPADRRVKQVGLTDTGEEGVELIHRERLASLQGALVQLDPEQLAAFAAALEPLAAIVEADACAAGPQSEESPSSK